MTSFSGGLSRPRVMVGLDDLKGLLQPRGFYDYMVHEIFLSPCSILIHHITRAIKNR